MKKMWFWVTLCSLVLAFGAFACGGDDDDNDNDDNDNDDNDDGATDADTDADSDSDSDADGYWADGTCNGQEIASSTDCAGISYEGCCDETWGDNVALWCDGNELYCLNCTESANECGWSDDGSFYGCGFTGTAPEEHPADCP